MMSAPVALAPSPANASLAAPASVPWYRHRWPWILMAGPAIVVVAGFHIMYVAFTQADGLVVRDYYKKGLSINQDHARDDVATRAGMVVTLTVTPQGVAGLWQATEPIAPPVTMSVRFMHVGQQDLDRVLLLRREVSGQWRAPGVTLTPGRYRVVIEAPQWRIVRSIDTRALGVDGFRLTMDARA